MILDDILQHNRAFVQDKAYEKFSTSSKYPEKKLAILACMDTRLIELIPAALGLKNGDMKIIKNAGGIITQPFDSGVRSLLIAIYELGVEHVLVLAHTDCGMQHIDTHVLVDHMKQRGISASNIEMMRYCGVNFESWLSGFDDTNQAVCQTVELIRHHPLIPADITVHGFIMNTRTGELIEAKDQIDSDK